ncbi:LOW QUALITY PROTEIN: cap-specific mRNA (nucleoside-2'-O-)-methyltransferase 2 [Nylanderia fulva]|uniref:LOW QUALITY PROTEIN: cap-specific mRNA (nucleoside-2'-O-)-methyltransferase 2 n=1 Tax=Nylanderia fulva TaxID=613905 RepID=UPI0010FAFD25|nr:LOW QUALITY PROTEIN: cap-specific mRNA (nucleoside-2'-O-)-methyltransferase 2 [Nylanderia fulva]
MMEKENSFTRRPLVDNNIDTLFEKNFLISGSGQMETYTLPNPTSMFKEPPWHLEHLQTLKASLNEIKSRLNNFDLCEWQQHTNQMNKAGDIVNTVKRNIQAELVTQAWCKFYEIASTFFLIPLNEIYCEENKSFTSVHLCEAPGAFITALNHWLKTNAPDVEWSWTATTLNPYCEGHSYNTMVPDDRFIRHTLKHWYFGVDNTGDVMDLRNLDIMVERFKQRNQKVLLVTADGSIDCKDIPGEQESAVAQLHLCETVACMHLLQEGGNFLLKLFTMFEHQSVCLIYLLSCSFHQVTATKPASSKAGNSEIYLVCTNFKGKDYVAPYLNILRHYCSNVSPKKAMFNLRDIPMPFLCKLQECNEFFKHHQCLVITENINTFRAERYNNILSELKHIKRKVVQKYIRTCRLSQIDSANEIVGRQILEMSNNFYTNRQWHDESYNERCKKQDLTPQEQLLQICNKMKKIELSMEKSYTWHLQAPDLEIRGGKSFNKVCSSHFCDSKILQMLNQIDDKLRDTRSKALYSFVFSSAEMIQEQRIDPTYEILSFQFFRDYDSHRTIAEIYDRLEQLQIGQTLVLIGYSLLTQLNVGLLYLVGDLFDNIIVEVHDNEGYRIKLEKYRRNDKILNNLLEILRASNNMRDQNMIWSVIPITFLYECHHFPVIVQLNHLMIKLYAHYISMIENSKT